MSFEMENIGGAMIVCISALFMIGIGKWASIRRDPMHFWAGTTVKAETIKDIPAYNRANARMWYIYGCGLIIGAIGMLINLTLGGILTVLFTMGGLVGMMIAYKKIHDKYKID